MQKGLRSRTLTNVDDLETYHWLVVETIRSKLVVFFETLVLKEKLGYHPIESLLR